MDDRLDWALAACSRVMRPLVRLALSMGVKHQQLDHAMRDLLLDEARRSWRAQGIEPNISQLSVTTGLNRKAVTARIRTSADALPHTDMSAASKTVTAWLELVAADAGLNKLPVTAPPGHPSFERLANDASRGNVHHRALLDELVRLRMADHHEGQVTLTVAGFIPIDDLRSMLAFLGDNGRDHLLAAVSNTLGGSPRMLERAVFASGLTVDDCSAIQQLMRDRWTELHHELANVMSTAVDDVHGQGAARIRVGIYAYHEARPVSDSVAPASPP
ncbi:MAG: hypothetical protein EOO28_35075 [Comamonadaceae bacterium]|nr:MAG: hypothetical protein EOO28_35075 [Comamonadaceae bacterium]